MLLQHHLRLSVLAVVLVCSAVLARRRVLEDFDPKVQNIVRGLTLKQKCGQLLQLNVPDFGLKKNPWDNTYYWDEWYLNKTFDDVAFGSMLNQPGLASVHEWRKAMKRLQQIALERGSGIPIVFGLDSVHGVNYIANSTLFPQNINTGATFNRSHARAVGMVTAKDSRAAGVHWSFAPNMDLALAASWTRVYEQFGEDPYLTSQMATHTIMGMQGSSLNRTDTIAATAKHYLAYGDPRSACDKGHAWVPEHLLRQMYIAPFRAAVKAGVATVMMSYNALNGVPMAINRKYNIDVLRNELDFDGVHITDWNQFQDLYIEYVHSSAPTFEDGVARAFQDTELDMNMQPNDISFGDACVKLVTNGQISLERVEMSVARVVSLKMKLGLFENPYPPPPDAPSVQTFGADRPLALAAARESLVLLRNPNNVLPLAPTNETKIVLIGDNCDAMRHQSGGWTFAWQGSEGDDQFTYGKTIKQAIEQQYSQVRTSFYRVYRWPWVRCPGNCFDLPWDGYNYGEEAAAVNELNSNKNAVAVVCLGEPAYTEKPGDIGNLDLIWQMTNLMNALHGTGRPIVGVYIGGRMRSHPFPIDYFAAYLWAGLPGPQGGIAVTEALFGDVNPSGRLPVTWSSGSSIGRMPYWRHAADMLPHAVPLYEFGHGLSYTTFEYSSLSVSPATVRDGDTVTVRLMVTNTGKVAGQHSVLLFTQQPIRKPISPEHKLLRGFEKIALEAGESQSVTFQVPVEELSFVGVDETTQYANGLVKVIVGVGATAVTSKFQLLANDCYDSEGEPVCHHGAKCTDLPRAFKCSCPLCYLGEQCDEIICDLMRKDVLATFKPEVAAATRALPLNEAAGHMLAVTWNDAGLALDTTGVWAVDESVLNATLDAACISMLVAPASLVFNQSAAFSNVATQLQWAEAIARVQTIAMTRGCRQPLLFAVEGPHGASMMSGATVLPHSLTVAATYNRSAAAVVGAITARQLRHVGVHVLLGPSVELGSMAMSPRVYETFGEDPLVAAQLGAAVVRELQGGQSGSLADDEHVAAAIHSFIAAADARIGQDGGGSWIPDSFVSRYFLPPFRAAIEGGARMVQFATNALNGVPVPLYNQYVEHVLRETLGFKGVTLLDDHLDMAKHHQVARSRADLLADLFAARNVSLAPLDVLVVPARELEESVEKITALLSEDRIRVSAARVVALKKELAVFTNPMPALTRATVPDTTAADEARSLDVARESLVLLQNWNVLPLSASSQLKLLLVGQACNSTRVMSGGYTVHLNGAANDDEIHGGMTLLKAIQTMYPEVQVQYQQGHRFNGYPNGYESVSDLGVNFDWAPHAVVYCQGEGPYAGSSGDLHSFEISPVIGGVSWAMNQRQFTRIAVLIGGRARALAATNGNYHGIIWAGLPGPSGGAAIAELLFGALNPSGRLPFTMHSASAGMLTVPYWRFGYDYTVQYSPYVPVFQFGSGLSYTTFSESVSLSQWMVHAGESLTVRVNVKNTGSRAGKHTVLLFVKTIKRWETPEKFMVKAFDKVELNAGESTELTFVLTMEDLAFYDHTNKKTVQNGDYKVGTWTDAEGPVGSVGWFRVEL